MGLCQVSNPVCRTGLAVKSEDYTTLPPHINYLEGGSVSCSKASARKQALKGGTLYSHSSHLAPFLLMDKLAPENMRRFFHLNVSWQSHCQKESLY